MVAKKTSEILKKLKSLAEFSGNNIYERIGLAFEVLRDAAWVEAEFAGDGERAVEYVTDKYFPVVCQYVHLEKLISAYRQYERPVWKDLRYDLAAIEARYDTDHKKDDQAERKTRTTYKTLWMAVLKEFAAYRKASCERELRQDEQLRLLTIQVNTSDARAQELLEKGARLQGRIDEMEKHIVPV